MASKMLLQEISRETFELGSGENQEVVVIHQPIICLASLGRQGHLPNSLASVSHFSMHFAILTTDSVWVEKRELGGEVGNVPVKLA